MSLVQSFLCILFSFGGCFAGSRTFKYAKSSLDISGDLLEQTSAETHILCVEKCSKDDNVDASLRCNAVRYNTLDKSCELVLSRGCEAPAAALQAHWTIYRLTNDAPRGWSRLGSRWYCVSTMSATWSQAANNCLAYNAHLTGISSAQENTYIYNLLRASKGWSAAVKVWVGGYVASFTEDVPTWEWHTRERWSYENFTTPDLHDGKDGECISVSSSSWDDYPCNSEFRFVCEKK